MAMICFSFDFARGFLVELSIFGLRNFVTCFAHFWWGSIKIALKVPLYGYSKNKTNKQTILRNVRAQSYVATDKSIRQSILITRLTWKMTVKNNSTAAIVRWNHLFRMKAFNQFGPQTYSCFKCCSCLMNLSHSSFPAVIGRRLVSTGSLEIKPWRSHTE